MLITLSTISRGIFHWRRPMDLIRKILAQTQAPANEQISIFTSSGIPINAPG